MNKYKVSMSIDVINEETGKHVIHVISSESDVKLYYNDDITNRLVLERLFHDARQQVKKSSLLVGEFQTPPF